MGSESAPRSSPGPAAPPCSCNRCCSCPAVPRAPGAAPTPRYPQPPPRTGRLLLGLGTFLGDGVDASSNMGTRHQN
ncbi:hypothetical protein AV530_005662 [Patagioenas fasciata monilis]|uniref:Uncharacterized protein n=1 Tax=Patagioenas fasciata monilis TaxID=372326 RepID=A0A1V4JM56_PATFA|nr:hypothetical protein AV530_005662 [Patagioenas fasciata monilis]